MLVSDPDTMLVGSPEVYLVSVWDVVKGGGVSTFKSNYHSLFITVVKGDAPLPETLHNPFPAPTTTLDRQNNRKTDRRYWASK